MVWVTAGAPLETGDGWRVWYSWPTGPFTPATPRIRTTAGVSKQVNSGAWDPRPPVKGSKRQMAVREYRIADATPGELYEVHVPERSRPLLLAHAARGDPRSRHEPADRLVLLDQRRP